MKMKNYNFHSILLLSVVLISLFAVSGLFLSVSDSSNSLTGYQTAYPLEIRSNTNGYGRLYKNYVQSYLYNVPGLPGPDRNGYVNFGDGNFLIDVKKVLSSSARIAKLTGKTCYYHMSTGNYYRFRITATKDNKINYSSEYPMPPNWYGGSGGNCHDLSFELPQNVFADKIDVQVVRVGGYPSVYNTQFTAHAFWTPPPIPAPTKQIIFPILPSPTPSPTPTPLSSVRLSSPNGGEQLISGEVYRIRWDASKDLTLIDLSLRSEGVNVGISIASDIPNTGSYTWTVPKKENIYYAFKSDKLKIKLTGKRLAQGGGFRDFSDESDNFFSILPFKLTPTPSPTQTPTPSPIQKCTDSDGGKEYFVFGKTVGLSPQTGKVYEGEDVCGVGSHLYAKEGQLVEHYCDGIYHTNTVYTCQYGCEKGACKKAPTDDLIITDITRDNTYYYVNYTNLGPQTSNAKFTFLMKNKNTGKSFESNPIYPFDVPKQFEQRVTGGFTCGLIGDSSCKNKITVEAQIDWKNTVSELNENNNNFVMNFASVTPPTPSPTPTPRPTPIKAPTLTPTPSPTPSPTQTPTPTPTPVKQLFVKVISPNGGETLKLGDNYRIKWDSQLADKVSVGYTTGAGNPTWIATDIPNQGFYDWKVNVPSTTVNKFKIFVLAYNLSVGAITDESDNFFTIIQQPIFAVTQPSPTPTPIQPITCNVLPSQTQKCPAGQWCKQNQPGSVAGTCMSTGTQIPYVKRQTCSLEGSCYRCPSRPRECLNNLLAELYEVTEYPLAPTHSPTPTTTPTQVPVLECIESDGGRDYYTQGTVIRKFGESQSIYPDSCNSVDNKNRKNRNYPATAVNEMSCAGNELISEYFNCPYGCENGACRKTPVATPTPEIKFVRVAFPIILEKTKPSLLTGRFWQWLTGRQTASTLKEYKMVVSFDNKELKYVSVAPSAGIKTTVKPDTTQIEITYALPSDFAGGEIAKLYFDKLSAGEAEVIIDSVTSNGVPVKVGKKIGVAK